MTDQSPKTIAGPPLSGAPGSVWVVTWYAMDGQDSGVHGLFESESDARKEAEAMTRIPRRSVYKASQWTVTPNAAGERPATTPK